MALYNPPSAWKILGASAATGMAITGTITETALATITVPAGAMGANGILRITTSWSVTNNANAKTLRVRLGGIGGTAFVVVAGASILTFVHQKLIQNRNSQAAQFATLPAANPNTFTSTSGANFTATVNTASAQDIVISGELANSGDTITLDSYLVEIAYRP